jgi:hypothetical protein
MTAWMSTALLLASFDDDDDDKMMMTTTTMTMALSRKRHDDLPQVLI